MLRDQAFLKEDKPEAELFFTFISSVLSVSPERDGCLLEPIAGKVSPEQEAQGSCEGQQTEMSPPRVLHSSRGLQEDPYKISA